MTEILKLVLAWLAGGVLGAFFFRGLWWTVEKGVSAKQPALWFAGSALLRMSTALGGFFFVSGGQWPRLLLCLLGFVMARRALVRPTRQARERGHYPAQESRGAP